MIHWTRNIQVRTQDEKTPMRKKEDAVNHLEFYVLDFPACLGARVAQTGPMRCKGEVYWWTWMGSDKVFALLIKKKKILAVKDLSPCFLARRRMAMLDLQQQSRDHEAQAKRGSEMAALISQSC